jgi:predicted MFS family arabinose efflux permease
MNKGRKPFYGWIIVAASMLIMMSIYGVVNNCYAFYIEPVTADLGFSRQGYSLSQSIIFVSMMCVAPFVGGVYRRFHLLSVMRAAAVVQIGAYAAYGLCRELWQFYALSIVIGVTQNFITTIPISIIVRNWFERSYGLALGVAFMGSGLGGMVFSPVIRSLIDAAGWRNTFFVIAAILAAVNFVTMFVLLRLKPSDMGLEPLRAADSPAVPDAEALTGAPLSGALRTARFWAVLLLCVVFAAASYGLCTYIPPYFTELGHSAAVATLCASAGMGVMAAGKVIYGRMLDKLGLKTSTLLSMSAMVVGFVGMILAADIRMVALVLLGIAVACPFGTVAPAIVVRDVFGTRDFGAKLGFYSAAGNLGAAISPFFGNAVYDATGGYRGAMVILTFVSAALFVGYALVIPRRAKPFIPKEG